MADLDKVLKEDPQAADFVDRPEFWVDDDEILVVCDVEFPALEFTEKERAEWMKIRDKYDLINVEQKYRDLLSELSKSNNSHLLTSKRERLNVITDQITKINKETDPLKWNDELEQKVEKLALQADKLTQEIDELSAPHDKNLLEKLDNIQNRLTELKNARDPAFLEMAWKLAIAKHDEKRDLETWLENAKGSDRLAAQELVYKGNFSWEAQRLSRAQRRAMMKNRKKGTGKDTENITLKP